MSSPGERRPDDGGYPTQQPAPDDRSGRSGPTPYDAQAAPPYVYNPYGNVSYPSSYPVPPAGLGPDAPLAPARRPGSLHLALLLLLVATVPYLLSGLLMVLGAAQVAAAAPEAQKEQLRTLGVDAEQVVRNAGILLLVVALVFAVLALLAWRGRRWARAVLALLTTGFVLLVVAILVAASGQGVVLDGASLLVIGGPAVLAVLGVVLMFGSAARAWFAGLRR